MNLSDLLRQHRSLVVGAAVLLPFVACAALAPFRDSVSAAIAVLVLVLIVVAAAATGDRIAGLVAALSGGVWFDFFLTRPFNTFTITDSQDVGTTVLLVLIGAAVTEVALWGRQQQARASLRAGYLDGALSTAEVLAGGHESQQQAIALVADQIVKVLGVIGCQFVPGPPHDARLAVLDHDGRVTRSGSPLRVERDGLPTDEYTALPVLHEGKTVGHFLLSSASEIARPSLEQRRVAVLLADQVGSVLGNRAS